MQIALQTFYRLRYSANGTFAGAVGLSKVLIFLLLGSSGHLWESEAAVIYANNTMYWSQTL